MKQNDGVSGLTVGVKRPREHSFYISEKKIGSFILNVVIQGKLQTSVTADMGVTMFIVRQNLVSILQPN